MRRKRTGPWEGRGGGGQCKLSSTCGRRPGRPGDLGVKKREGRARGRRPGGRGREASASGPFPGPQRKAEMRVLPSKREAS